MPTLAEREPATHLPYLAGLVPRLNDDGNPLAWFYELGDIDFILQELPQGGTAGKHYRVYASGASLKEWEISPGRRAFGKAKGWVVEITSGIGLIVNYAEAEKEHESGVFKNVWKWESDGLRLLSEKSYHREISFSGLGAIVPVPRKHKIASLEDCGGILIVPISELSKGHTVKMLEGFLSSRISK